MRLAPLRSASLSLAFCCFAQVSPVSADDATVLAEARAIVQTAIGQQRVFLNCSYLQPKFQDVLKENWQKDVDAASTMLLGHPATRDYVPELQRDANIASLMMKGDTTLESFCKDNIALLEAYERLDFVIMRFALDDVLKTRD